MFSHIMTVNELYCQSRMIYLAFCSAQAYTVHLTGLTHESGVEIKKKVTVYHDLEHYNCSEKTSAYS